MYVYVCGCVLGEKAYCSLVPTYYKQGTLYLESVDEGREDSETCRYFVQNGKDRLQSVPLILRGA